MRGGHSIYDKIAEIIDWAERQSTGICEMCGKNGKMRTEDYLQVLCDDCSDREED